MDEPGESSNPHALVGHPEAAGPHRRVFISYASNDAAIAQKVCAALEAAGFPCWIAPRDVVPGTLYADGIVGAIDETKILVLILSKDAVASAHVGKELERATSKRHPIIALRLDTAPLTRAFEYFLNESQWIEVHANGSDVAIAQLVSSRAASLTRNSGSESHQTIRRRPEQASAAATNLADRGCRAPRAGCGLFHGGRFGAI